MAISAIVNITDAATPALDALVLVMTVKEIGSVVGEAEVILFQNHFRNAPGNKKNWPTTSFWPRAAKATNWKANDLGVLINVNQQGVRQRYVGGEIHPTAGHQYLTIPARAEAYGKTARKFDNLKVAFSRGKAFALVEADATQITYGKRDRKSGQRSFSTDTVGGGVYFWLVKSVYQAPDPNVLPADADISSVAMDAIRDLAERVSDDLSKN